MYSLVEDSYNHIVKSIAKARNLPEQQVFEIMSKGPYTAQEAQKLGLIDELSFEHAVVESAIKKADGKKEQIPSVSSTFCCLSRGISVTNYLCCSCIPSACPLFF